jgi:Fe-S cluster assembly iron-binding protein IscA
MLTITEKASIQLQEFLTSEKAKGAKLVIYFQGVG